MQARKGAAVINLPRPGDTTRKTAAGTPLPALPKEPALVTNKNSLAHIAYLVTIWIKGFFGLLEFTGGAIIAVFGPQRLAGAVLRWLDPELYEGGHFRTAELVREGAAALASSHVTFVVFYLFVHGSLKMAITGVLVRGHGAWVFPFASVILLGFIGFFCLDLSRHWSDMVLALAAFDTLTLALVLNEWRNWRKD